MSETLTKVFVFVAVFCIVMLLGLLLTQWAWNTFMPSIFGLSTITFKQAVALMLLAIALRGTHTRSKS